jgi:His/Glu/Gln/Arg/opine family amino acid ABC transporter permease subunit
LRGWGAEIALGLGLTVATALLSLALGVVLALIVAILKQSRSLPARILGDAYTTIVRGTPELLIVLLAYFGSSIVAHRILLLWGLDVWIQVPVLASGVAALAVVFAGYAAESIRGGMLAIEPGQIEAAEAFGLSAWSRLTLIKIPLIWRHALPALGNNWLSLIKSTSLVSLISLEELMRKCSLAADGTGLYFRFYMVAAGIYLCLTGLNVMVLSRLERAARRTG